MTQLPCRKCSKAGLECTLTRPFRWVNGAIISSKGARTATESTYAVSNHIAVRKPPWAKDDASYGQVVTYTQHEWSSCETDRGEVVRIEHEGIIRF
jgi:hypothetical protein